MRVIKPFGLLIVAPALALALALSAVSASGAAAEGEYALSDEEAITADNGVSAAARQDIGSTSRVKMHPSKTYNVGEYSWTGGTSPASATGSTTALT